MPMNIEDTDLLSAERDASPERWQQYDPNNHFEETSAAVRARYNATHNRSQSQNEPSAQQQDNDNQNDEPVEAVETASVSSGSSSSSSAASPGGEMRGRHHRPSVATTVSGISRLDTRTEKALMAYLDRHPTAIERMEQHRLQHMQTVGTGNAKSREGYVLPDFGGGKPYPPPLPDKEEYVVEFTGHDDPLHPQNWPFKKKIYISCILVLDALAATFASSIFSPTSSFIEKEFHVGQEVVTLGTSLFVLGYAVGPVIFAPLSELYGRRLPIIFAAFAFGVFNIAVAVAKDYQTVVICRFFSGFFGSCPLTLCAAVFSDMYNNKVRGVAVAFFSATLMNGPFCGPFVGGFVAKSYLGWRWTAYLPAFMGFAACVLSLFFQEESYGPVILVSKASELRRMTRNWGIHAKQEEVEVDFKELAVKNLSRPLRILFTEPIVLFITIYMSFIYGLLYLNLTAYELVYGRNYGWSLGVSGLPYIALIVGVMIGFGLVVYLNNSYVKKLDANNNIPVPEWRMPVAAVGGIVFTIGLFWFGWTGWRPNRIPWIVPTLAGIFIGFGIFTVFLQCLNYIIDAYLMFAASAIAANTLMRSLFGAIFPLFATYMFEGIGINWGMTFLGCISLIFVPMPFLFIRYGKKIRKLSKFAPAPDIQQDEQHQDEESGGGEESTDKDAEKEGSESSGTAPNEKTE